MNEVIYLFVFAQLRPGMGAIHEVATVRAGSGSSIKMEGREVGRIPWAMSSYGWSFITDHYRRRYPRRNMT